MLDEYQLSWYSCGLWGGEVLGFVANMDFGDAFDVFRVFALPRFYGLRLILLRFLEIADWLVVSDDDDKKKYDI